MRQFILKTSIVVIAVYILFQVTIGYRVDFYSSKIKSLANQSNRIELKQKILNEMEKGVKKENFFSVEERIIISKFINKIIKELSLNTN
tara:strand:- start:42 stop:308 length:267 start_codon:yes stop_codon:yes gene_type:complete